MPSAADTLLALARFPIPETLAPFADGSAQHIERTAEAAGVTLTADVLWAIVIGGATQRSLAAMLTNEQLSALGAALGPMGAMLALVQADPGTPTPAEQIVVLGVAVLARRILAGDL